jgi:hypothetical protein
VAVATIFQRTLSWLTPEEARSWELLRAFRGQDGRLARTEEKAARAKEKLLDQLREGVTRR